MKRGTRYYRFQVKGVTHPNRDGSDRQSPIRGCHPGDAVSFVAEPNNSTDSHAVRMVLIQTGEQIGYVSHSVSAWTCDALRNGEISNPSIAAVFPFSYQGERWVGAVVLATLSGDAVQNFPTQRRRRRQNASAPYATPNTNHAEFGYMTVVVLVGIFMLLSWLLRAC